MDHEIFLTKSVTGPLCIGIGSRKRRQRVWLTDADVMKLAYRLMSLGSGGETQGIEQFDRNAAALDAAREGAA